GWQDLFLPQTLQQYRHLRDRGVDVALTMGPWTHTQLLFGGLATFARETQDWLDTHLGGRPTQARSDRVRFFVAGEGWRELPDWPPTTTERALYLQPGGGLVETPPSPAVSSSASFRYDPADPTPTIGGRLLSPDGGYRDDTALAARRDVLSFTSDVLTDDLYVHGNPVAELAHSSDNPHVDVFVRISEVDPKGRSRNVSDGYRRLDGTPHGGNTVSLELDAIAHRFRAGSRIRVLIAGGSHPRYARNLGTGEATVTGSRLTPSTHEVHLGASRVLLPVGS
ncbi:MAG: CocE/NonD family hydrolase, partial [Mycobacterium sp.]